MIGGLFNNITPFASGGQPMQSYVMYREGQYRQSDGKINLTAWTADLSEVISKLGVSSAGIVKLKKDIEELFSYNAQLSKRYKKMTI